MFNELSVRERITEIPSTRKPRAEGGGHDQVLGASGPRKFPEYSAWSPR